MCGIVREGRASKKGCGDCVGTCAKGGCRRAFVAHVQTLDLVPNFVPGLTTPR